MHAVHNLASLLHRTARCWPHLPAVALGAQVIHRYAALAERAARLAGALEAGGLRRGDRVALAAHNVPEYIETLFGCWWAGLIVVPVNSKLHPKELAHVLADSGVRWVFVDAAWHAALGSLAGATATLERAIELGSVEYARLCAGPPLADPDACAASDAAWLFYTSGTTGRPKGVVISHGNLRAMSQCFLSDVEAIAPGDTILHAAPLSHGSGLYAVPHVLAGALHVIPESGGFEVAEVAHLLGAWNRTCMFAAPTMVMRLVSTAALRESQRDRLKCIVYGGGPMYIANCKAAYATLGPRLAQIYGQGESPMTITAMNRALLADAIQRNDDARIGSVGVAQTNVDVRIAAIDAASPSDTMLPAGEAGEVLVRGPAVMQGYWRDPDATAVTLAGGWLRTGDVGALDDDGFLTLKDRSKDLIISGGTNIYPREVEEVLSMHADIAAVAVVGRPHPEWGEEVVACVVVRGEAAVVASARAVLERELDALCLDHIARFKRPKAYVFLDDLPTNNAGKVLKTVLRRRLAPAG